MDINKLNQLIKKVRIINSNANNDENFFIADSLDDCMTEIKLQYGSFLLEKLFDIYDDYFSDNEMVSLEEYLTDEGVEVDGEDFDEVHSRLTIRSNPLRFEVTGINNTFKEVIWQAA